MTRLSAVVTTLFLLVVFAAVAVVSYLNGCQAVEIQPGLTVWTGHGVAYTKNAPGGWEHQFWGCGELRSFEVVNNSQETRYLRVHSLCGWEAPVTGHLRICPGQKITIGISFTHDWWLWLDSRDLAVARS